MAGYMTHLQGYVYEGELVNGEETAIPNGAFVVPAASNGKLVMKLVDEDDDFELLCKAATTIYDNISAYRFVVVKPGNVWFVENGHDVNTSGAYDTTEYTTEPGKYLRAHRLATGDEFITNAIDGYFEAGRSYTLADGSIAGTKWNVDILACPDTAAMPASETASNSALATFAISGNEITITLSVKVSTLSDADHGSTWGTHKWLGFGIDTGLDSVAGVQFTDDTGASATLTNDDAGEAATLGLTAGQFVLYIKAEDEDYLTGNKSFTLKADGYPEATYTMKIVEPD